VSHPPIHPRPPLGIATALLRSADLPTDDLELANLEHFFFAGDATDPVGLVGVELFGADALLRSLVVRPQARTAGLGSHLVTHAEDYARARGVRSMYLLTTTAEAFFRARGYSPAQRQEAPASIQATREFAGLCPASSAFMIKRLQETLR
jgi:amino-acid N-acetyltransferase